MATHLTVRVMTELPGNTAAEKEAWLKSAYNKKTHQWRHAEGGEEAGAQEAYYRRKIAKVLDGMPEAIRRRVDRPDTLVIVTPTSLARFTGDKNDENRAGVSFRNEHVVVVSLDTQPLTYAKFLKDVFTDFEMRAAHELTHIAFSDIPLKRKGIHNLAVQAAKRTKTIAPEETAQMQNALDRGWAEGHSVQRWNDLDFNFAALGKKKELAVHIWEACNPYLYDSVYDYEPADRYEEIVCNLAALSHKYGRKAVHAVAGELMDYLDGLLPKGAGSPARAATRER